MKTLRLIGLSVLLCCFAHAQVPPILRNDFTTNDSPSARNVATGIVNAVTSGKMNASGGLGTNNVLRNTTNVGNTYGANLSLSGPLAVGGNSEIDGEALFSGQVDIGGAVFPANAYTADGIQSINGSVGGLLGIGSGLSLVANTLAVALATSGSGSYVLNNGSTLTGTATFSNAPGSTSVFWQAETGSVVVAHLGALGSFRLYTSYIDANTNAGFWIARTNGQISQGTFAIGTGMVAPTNIYYGSNGAPQLAFLPNGNIGVETATPGVELDVVGTTRSSRIVFINGITNSSGGTFGIDAGGNLGTTGTVAMGTSTTTGTSTSLVSQVKFLKSLGQTPSRVTYLDAQGNLTNVTSSSASTDYVHADGTVGGTTGNGTLVASNGPTINNPNFIGTISLNSSGGGSNLFGTTSFTGNVYQSSGAVQFTNNMAGYLSPLTNPVTLAAIFWTNTTGYRVKLSINYLLTDSAVSGSPGLCMTNCSSGDYFNATNSFVLAGLSAGSRMFVLGPGEYVCVTNKSSGSASASIDSSFATKE